MDLSSPHFGLCITIIVLQLFRETIPFCCELKVGLLEYASRSNLVSCVVLCNPTDIHIVSLRNEGQLARYIASKTQVTQYTLGISSKISAQGGGGGG